MPNRHAVNSEVEEIDIFEILRALYLQRWIILGITVLITGVAIAIANLTTPVYEAKMFVLPPKQSQIVGFNIGRDNKSDLAPFSVKDIYDVFLRNLQSESLKRRFFAEIYLPSLNDSKKQAPQDVLYADFLSRLTVIPPGKDLVDRYAIAFQAQDPKQAFDWASDYIKKAGSVATQEVTQNALREAQGKARNLDQQVAMYRERARKSREDWIIQLREALKIAEAIDLEKPLIISGNLSAEISGSMGGQLIYMRGTKALRAEIENLESRAADDPFIEDLRNMEANSELLKTLAIPSDVAVYREDGEIKQPDSPIKPRKITIYALGVIAGLGFGVLLALLRLFIARGRSRHFSRI